MATMDNGAGADTRLEDAGLDDDLYDEAVQEHVKPQAEQPHQAAESASADDDDYARAFDTPPGEKEEEDVNSDALKPQDVPQASESTQIAVAHETSLPTPVPQPTSLPEAGHDAVAPQSASGVQDLKPSSPEPGDPGAQAKPASSLAHDESPNISAILAALNRQAEAGQTGQDADVPAAKPPTSGPPGTQDKVLAQPAVPADLPSKPPVQPPPMAAASPYHDMAPSVAQSAMVSPSGPGPTSFFPLTHGAAPGTDSVAGHHVAAPPPSLPPIPPTPNDSSHAQHSYPVGNTDSGTNASYLSLWETYLADEKRYTADQSWDRFPEGSRIFVGNLSSDKVAKRDVFHVFHRYGRLAQISLKSAFGFVQYHTPEEGRAAIENLQDYEIKGRKIHLEVSRTKAQNRERERERERERDREAADRGGRSRGSKYDGGGTQGRRGRDGRDSRGGDTRGHGRDDSYGRDRAFYDSVRPRDRSMSPRRRRDRQGPDQYRHRSPSPYGRPLHNDAPRYGSRNGSSTEVLLLVLDSIDSQFISWVRESFDHNGLSTGVEHFRYDEDKKKLMARKAATEGVKAVVDLDRRSTITRMVVSYIFDSSRPHDIRYDEFPALPPETAAQVVLKQLQERGYRSAQPSYGAYNGGYSAAQYPPAYHGQSHTPAQLTPFAAPPPGAGPTYGAPANVGQPAQNVQDILSRLQHSAPPGPAGHLANSPPIIMPGTVPPPAHSPTGYGMPAHFPPPNAAQPHQMPTPPVAQGYGGPPSVDPQTKQNVDSIMAHLARLRQP